MTGIGDNGESGYESTLHLVTHAPVPAGIEHRVHAALQAAPRSARILAWPMAGWVRTAAAAAIVVVVGGGGWGVYRHAQVHQPSRMIASPAPVVVAPTAGGFSSAGAIRTPQTVKGPAAIETPAGKKSAVKPIPSWDSTTPQGSSAKTAKKRSAVKPIPNSVESPAPDAGAAQILR